jgi:hypothetical protein
MLRVLDPLVLGFALNCPSAFTTGFSRRWSARAGGLITVVLRDVLGIPLWCVGLGFAMHAASTSLFARSAAATALDWELTTAGAAVSVAGALRVRRAR